MVAEFTVFARPTQVGARETSVFTRQIDRLLDSESCPDLQFRLVGADVVLSANPGCIMQIGGGLVMEGETGRVIHPLELLARSSA